MARSLTRVRRTIERSSAKPPVPPAQTVSSPLMEQAGNHNRRSCPCLPAVSRIKARSDMYEMDLTLDVNTDIYPVRRSGSADGLLQLLLQWGKP